MDYTVTLTDVEEKALLWDMMDIQGWIDNAVYNKVRQCTDEICRLALEDQTATILAKAEKRQIQASLNAQGIVLTSIKQLPGDIKGQIVAAARIKSAKEREAELLASLETESE
jgi:hypothetical protein